MVNFLLGAIAVVAFNLILIGLLMMFGGNK